MTRTIGRKVSQMAAVAGFACACTLPAVSQVGIYIGRTPPPLRYEVPPPTPGPEYAWNEGYWNWANNQSVGARTMGAAAVCGGVLGASAL